MKIDGEFLVGVTPGQVVDAAVRSEARGWDGAFSSETAYDPFLPLQSAIERTRRIDLGTAVAVGFARSPMTLAQTANDLQRASAGRFILGLGSQVKPHIVRRFSMPWSRPTERMRELLMALQAIWDHWNEGDELQFVGEFYQHTLSPPMFRPPPNPFGRPRVVLAGVGPRMTELAGEVADGLVCHAFTTPQYLAATTMASLRAGKVRSSEPDRPFEVMLPVLIATGETPAQRRDNELAVRKQIAFYASTPAYRGVLEFHGWHSLGPELTALSKRGQWTEMGAAIDDDVLATFAVVAEPDRVGRELLSRFGDLIDRISFYTPSPVDPSVWDQVARDIRDGSVERATRRDPTSPHDWSADDHR